MNTLLTFRPDALGLVCFRVPEKFLQAIIDMMDKRLRQHHEESRLRLWQSVSIRLVKLPGEATIQEKSSLKGAPLIASVSLTPTGGHYCHGGRWKERKANTFY